MLSLREHQQYFYSEEIRTQILSAYSISCFSADSTFKQALAKYHLIVTTINIMELIHAKGKQLYDPHLFWWESYSLSN
jgi:hypothetical protein